MSEPNEDYKVRIKNIEKADQIYVFSHEIFSSKRVELLRKAAKLYRDSSLSFLADEVEKEANIWEQWSNF